MLTTMMKKKKKKKAKAKLSSADASQLGPLSDAPCLFCRNFYYGPGKAFPQVDALDREMRQMVKDVSRAFSQTGLLSPRKQFRSRMNMGMTDAGTVLTKTWLQFCSWRCVRAHNQATAPVQYRYRNDVLIEIAASADQDMHMLVET